MTKTGYSNLKTEKKALLKSVIDIDISPYAMHDPTSEAVDFFTDIVATFSILKQVVLEDNGSRD